MKIGGYEPNSFCDFPGRVAAVVFTQGCNFRCPFCHNVRLLPLNATASNLIQPDTILQRLKKRTGQLDGVVVTGGEPTLQPDLAEFLGEVRSLGLQTKLDTNGSNPDCLAKLFEAGLLDYVAMDVKAPWAKYAQLSGLRVSVEAIAKSMRLIAKSGIAHEFRTTAVGALLVDEDIEMVRNQIPSGSSHRVLPFRPESALDPRMRNSSKHLDALAQKALISDQICRTF